MQAHSLLMIGYVCVLEHGGLVSGSVYVMGRVCVCEMKSEPQL